MQAIYPTRPVICNNESLRSRYNGRSEAAMLCSQCLTTNQALRLLDEGAKFEAIVCIDADGQEVLKKIGYKQQSWDIEFDTRVEHYATNLDEEADIDAILGKAQGECYMLYGMG